MFAAERFARSGTATAQQQEVCRPQSPHAHGFHSRGSWRHADSFSQAPRMPMRMFPMPQQLTRPQLPQFPQLPQQQFQQQFPQQQQQLPQLPQQQQPPAAASAAG